MARISIQTIAELKNQTFSKLENVYNFQYGQFNINPDNGGAYPIYGANGIIGGYTEFNAEKSVIIGHMGENAGSVLWEEAKHFVTYNGTIAKPKNENELNAKFGYYWLVNLNIRKICAGSGQPFLSYNDLNELPITFPPLPEQKKIASVLSALDNKIALNKKMNQKLEAMAKRLYDYWFVQYDFPDKNGRPYKTTGGKMVWNEVLKREIPEGWSVSLVSDVIKPIERGISYTSEDIKNSLGIPMINLACFDKKGNYRTGELKFYSGEYDESNKVYPLDILIACTDLTQKADIIGTPIFLSAEAPFYVFSTDLAKITPKNEFHKYFLYYYLKNPTFHRYIKPFASGTTVKHLNVKGVENYPIFIPDEKVVKQFTETVRPMIIAINERINEINRLTALRDKLLPLLMNGQVEIK